MADLPSSGPDKDIKLGEEPLTGLSDTGRDVPALLDASTPGSIPATTAMAPKTVRRYNTAFAVTNLAVSLEVSSIQRLSR